MSALRILKKEDGNLKKNDLYMISGTEYKEMTKEILAQSDLWAEIKKKADQKQKNADQMLIGIKPNLVSPTEASYGATTHPELSLIHI